MVISNVVTVCLHVHYIFSKIFNTLTLTDIIFAFASQYHHRRCQWVDGVYFLIFEPRSKEWYAEAAVRFKDSWEWFFQGV